jgi:ABC-2 type transport system permease protein
MRDRILHASAFTRAELVSTLRQPRLLLVLILGPFLVLFVFGLGYERSVPPLATVVVGADSPITERVDQFLEEAEPAHIDYRGTSGDREATLAALRDGELDLVVVLPDRALDTLGRGERAVIEVQHRSLDPVTSAQIQVTADIAVNEVNDRILEEVVAGAQTETAEFEEAVTTARDQLEAVRSAVSDRDLAALQSRGAQLGSQLERTAGFLRDNAGLATRLGLGGIDETVQRLEAAAALLDDLSTLEVADQLDEIDSTITRIEGVITQVRDAEPEIVVRPFVADVESLAPVDVTLDRFYAPGLLALMLQHIGVTFAAMSLVRERGRGTTRLLRVLPATEGERLTGKTLAFVVLGSLAAAVLTALIVGVFGVPLPVDWAQYVVVALTTLLASIGIGFLVAAWAENDSQAVQVSMLVLLAAIFFSGLFMPLERIRMPAILVSWLLPATHGFVGFQDLMLLQRPVEPLSPLALVILAVVTLPLARWRLARRPVL